MLFSDKEVAFCHLSLLRQSHRGHLSPFKQHINLNKVATQSLDFLIYKRHP